MMKMRMMEMMIRLTDSAKIQKGLKHLICLFVYLLMKTLTVMSQYLSSQRRRFRLSLTLAHVSFQSFLSEPASVSVLTSSHVAEPRGQGNKLDLIPTIDQPHPI